LKMRTLIYVPVIHTSADLGSIAGDVTKRGIAGVGEEIWARHGNTVDGFWDAISKYFGSVDVTGMKIYQDGMVADGEVGRRIVEDTANAGSKNYQLVAKLLERGAVLVKTEDFKLVKREYYMLLGVTLAKTVVQKIIALIRYKLVKGILLKKRDAFIAARIDETLGSGEKGILFIGAIHNVKEKLHNSIHVREIKDQEKVRKYQNLLLFHKKHKDQFDRLGEYLISDVAL